MKTTDSVMREKFEQYMSNGFHEHALRFPEAENTQFESGFDVSQEIAEKFISHSLAEARREERERIRGIAEKKKLSMTADIAIKLDAGYYISPPVNEQFRLVYNQALSDLLTDLLTGDNPERKVV